MDLSQLGHLVFGDALLARLMDINGAPARIAIDRIRVLVRMKKMGSQGFQNTVNPTLQRA